MSDFQTTAPRIAVNIMYDGTRYCGWQVQQNAVSVQQMVQNALEELLSFRPDISGCSRTDAGVHANQYVFHMSAENIRISPEKLPLALNARLGYCRQKRMPCAAGLSCPLQLHSKGVYL